MWLRLAFSLACLFCAPAAPAATIQSFYGDDDGFGVGVASGALTSDQIQAINATADDAQFTDAPMFTDTLFQPQFRPTGSFTPFTVTGEIVSATLTLRVAGLRILPNSATSNRIFLDTFDIGTGLLEQQIPNRPAPHTEIDEITIPLSSFFFPFLADGAVSLDNTRILQFTENSFSSVGAFQVDFIRLTIETSDPSPVPLPAAAPLLLLGLGTFAVVGRRGRRSSAPV